MRLSDLVSFIVLSLLSCLSEAKGGVRVPYICKIRKVNCSLRPESVCCPTITADDRIDIVDNEEDYHDANENLGNKDGDNLIQIASNIHEVVVKPNGEPVKSPGHEQNQELESEVKVSSETSSPTTTTTVASTTTSAEIANDSEKETENVPSFCLKLKFNCKLFSFHACCKHKKANTAVQPDVNELKSSLLVKVTKDRVKHPKEVTKENVPEGPEESKSKEIISEEKKKFYPKKTKSKYSYNKYSKNVSKNKSKVQPAESDILIPTRSAIIPSSSKKSIFGFSRKPGKSGLCKIINCGRNKNHFCCKEEQHEEEESKVIENNEISVETTEPVTTKAVKETTPSIDEKNSEIPVQLNETDVQESEADTDIQETTVLAETTMNYEDVVDDGNETPDITTDTTDSQSTEENTANFTELEAETTTMMNYEQINDEDVTETEAATEKLDEIIEDTSESFDEVTMVSKSQSESYEETRIWYDGINDRGEFVDTKPYHITKDENGETVVQVYPVYIPPQQKFLAYNTIDNDITNNVDNERHVDEDTDIIKEITCEHVDCLAWPGNKCCSPHVTKKRHSQDDINDKITATIIRIVKSVRWV